MKKTTKSAKTCPELVEWICLPWRSCRLAKTGVNSWIKMNLVNPVIPSKNVILSDAKVEYTGCPITMLILKNEPKTNPNEPKLGQSGQFRKRFSGKDIFFFDCTTAFSSALWGYAGAVTMIENDYIIVQE